MEGQFSESKKRFILLTFTKELIRNSGNGEFFKLESAIKEELDQPKKNQLFDFKDVYGDQSKFSEKRMLPGLEILPPPKPIITKKEFPKAENVFEEKSILSNDKTTSDLNKTPGLKSIIPKEKERLTKTIEISNIKKAEENLVNVLESGRSNRAPLAVQPKRKWKTSPLKIPRQTLPPRFGYLKPIPTRREIDLGSLNPLVNDPLVKNIECNGSDKNIIVEGSMGRRTTAIKLDRKEIDEVIEKFSRAAKIPVSEGIFRVVYGRFTFSAIISEMVSSKFIIRKTVYTPSFQNNR